MNKAGVYVANIEADRSSFPVPALRFSFLIRKTLMPNIFVNIPKDTFSTEQVDRLGKSITDAAHAAERIPEDQKHHFLTWLTVEEIRPEYLFIAGKRALPDFVPIIVKFYQPAGVMDMKQRELLSELTDKAIREALGEAAANVLISCIMLDVPDGHWGANGSVWALPQITQLAGFQHLSHLVEEAS